ncbi:MULTISPECIES: MerR family DNA-binding protein [unclassified Cronobacter]|uniref:MerR family DNA-binding protein n=1 Tax=unclassified Cronobacter TaxID=2649764 RepID=UPI0021029BAD|nr:MULTISPECIES: MerR family DNA-binding protein [unclassified Cronobacter]
MSGVRINVGTYVRIDRFLDKQAIIQVRQIQRLIATGFSVAEIRSFPDCMLLVEGARFCPETQAVQYQRLKDIEKQIKELEQRKARLLETLRQNGHSDAVTLHE